MNLLDFAEKYPSQPGHRGVDTSIEAAEAVKPDVARRRAMVLATIAASDGLTPDEVADRLGLPTTSVRPRVTELKLLGKIVDTGARRLTAAGCRARVWRVATVEEQASHQRKVAA